MDQRDVAAATRPWWKSGSIDERTMRLIAVIWDENADEIEIDAPFLYATCGLCHGKGRHVDPNIDRQGISQDEFNADPQFFEDYMGGIYDMECSRCGGMRVVPVPDERGVWRDSSHLGMVKEHIALVAEEARSSINDAVRGY